METGHSEAWEPMLMTDLARTFRHWVGYVWPWLFVALIINGVLILMVSSTDNGIWGFLDRASRDAGENPKGNVYVIAFVFLGPLYNLYATIIGIKSAVEADDDYRFEMREFTHLPEPNPKIQRLLKAGLSVALGFILLPFTFWLYTAQSSLLWGHEVSLFLQPGLLLSLGLILLSFVVVPRFFPGVAKFLFGMEEKISNRLS